MQALSLVIINKSELDRSMCYDTFESNYDEVWQFELLTMFLHTFQGSYHEISDFPICENILNILISLDMDKHKLQHSPHNLCESQSNWKTKVAVRKHYVSFSSLRFISNISFSSSNTQFYESQIFCLFTFWVFFPDKSFKLILK